MLSSVLYCSRIHFTIIHFVFSYFHSSSSVLCFVSIRMYVFWRLYSVPPIDENYFFFDFVISSSCRDMEMKIKQKNYYYFSFTFFNVSVGNVCCTHCNCSKWVYLLIYCYLDSLILFFCFVFVSKAENINRWTKDHFVTPNIKWNGRILFFFFFFPFRSSLT